MGIFDKIFGGKDEAKEQINLDNILEMGEEDITNPPAKMYVKKVILRNEKDYDLISKEINEGNIIIVDARPLVKQPNRLKNILSKIKALAEKVNGDIAALNQSGSALIVTPSAVKIVKSKRF